MTPAYRRIITQNYIAIIFSSKRHFLFLTKGNQIVFFTFLLVLFDQGV
jgi:hypothetical protein